MRSEPYYLPSHEAGADHLSHLRDSSGNLIPVAYGGFQVSSYYNYLVLILTIALAFFYVQRAILSLTRELAKYRQSNLDIIQKLHKAQQESMKSLEVATHSIENLKAIAKAGESA